MAHKACWLTLWQLALTTGTCCSSAIASSGSQEWLPLLPGVVCCLTPSEALSCLLIRPHQLGCTSIGNCSRWLRRCHVQVQGDESMKFDWDDAMGNASRRAKSLQEEAYRQKEIKRKRQANKAASNKAAPPRSRGR